MRISPTPAATLLAAAIALPACGTDATAPPSPDAIEVVSGAGQTASVTVTLPLPVRVRVLDGERRPLQGARVRWHAGGGGRVPASETHTDADGMTTSPWTLGFRAGEQRLAAVAGPAAAEVVAHATPGAPASVRLSRGDVRFQALGDSVLFDPAAVEDRFGNRIDGARVAWRTTDSAVAAVSAAGWVRSTGNGEAEIQARLEGALAGVHVAVAQRSEAVRLSPDTLRLAPGGLAWLEALSTDHNGYRIDALFRWTSSDSAVVHVDATGRVQARSEGEARVVVGVVEPAAPALGGGPGSTTDSAVVIVAPSGQSGAQGS
ncbi:MAG TPA: Ig-like domain-containing protein [Longimicrobiales bacterium]|nr:Ig-like domain-containing protein [Longimicrobiales bacterium]